MTNRDVGNLTMRRLRKLREDLRVTLKLYEGKPDVCAACQSQLSEVDREIRRREVADGIKVLKQARPQ